jgi:[ribosomal protein S18]-alanine N-acetyltransferase
VVTLDVAPEFRRHGLARRMMRSMEETVLEAGCSSMLLHVFVGNAEAIRFYESMGWERGHTVDAFYGDGLDALVYRKRLGDGSSEAS